MARTEKGVDQPVCGLVMVPPQSRFELMSSWMRTQLPLFGALGWYLWPLVMNETQNSVPWVEAFWANEAEVKKKSTAKIKRVNLDYFMALKF